MSADKKKIRYPSKSLPIKETTKVSHELIYNWRNNLYAEQLCEKYLKDFIEYQVNHSAFTKQYKRIILAQCYNEQELIADFLDNMAKHFDGIILLDDESTDNTYQLAEHEKLLLKVKKKRIEFNDLENRNLLLNLASFFSSEWFCFMDIDERFDERFADFNQCEIHDVIAFSLVHLWDNEEHYNADYPRTENGVAMLMRMFRNVGRMQIRAIQKKLHFAATPIRQNIFNSTILVKHYGNLSKEQRERKYDFYQKEDKAKDMKDYEYLKKDVTLLPLADITIKNGSLVNLNSIQK